MHGFRAYGPDFPETEPELVGMLFPRLFHRRCLGLSMNGFRAYGPDFAEPESEPEPEHFTNLQVLLDYLLVLSLPFPCSTSFDFS